MIQFVRLQITFTIHYFFYSCVLFCDELIVSVYKETTMGNLFSKIERTHRSMICKFFEMEKTTKTKLQSNKDQMKHGTVVKVHKIDISCVYIIILFDSHIMGTNWICACKVLHLELYFISNTNERPPKNDTRNMCTLTHSHKYRECACFLGSLFSYSNLIWSKIRA